MGASLAPGVALTARLSALRTRLAGERLDALLVTNTANIFYLSNFRGSAGMLLIEHERASLLLDARYVSAARTLLASDHGCHEMTLVPVESSYEETACRGSASRRRI